MNDLKICPFCPISQVEVYFEENVDMIEKYKAGCGACGCSTPIYPNKEQAKIFWNNRTNKKNPNNCPMCDEYVELSEFKIIDGGKNWYRYCCNNCNFKSGQSPNKIQVMTTWMNRT